MYERSHRIARQQAIRDLRCLGILAALASGCSGGDAEMAPVTGVVLMNGEPVANVFVKFQPAALAGEVNAPTKAAMAATDDQGRYDLSTHVTGDGAAVGLHTVSIVAVDSESSPPGILPPGHQVEVEAGENTINLELEPRRR